MRIVADFEEELDTDDCKKSRDDMAALIVGNCDQQKKEALIVAAEMHLSEEISPASDFESKQHEPAEEVLHVSGKVNEPQANCGVVEEQMISVCSLKKLEGKVDAHSEKETDGGEGKEMFGSSAIAALLKAVSGPDSEYGSAHAGARSFIQHVMSTATPFTLCDSSEENFSEEEKKRLQKLQQLKVKFLRLVQRLGYTVESSPAGIAADVMYKLSDMTGRAIDPAFSFDDARQKAMKLEAEDKDGLNFSVNILVLGKTGVGKSATINCIFGEEKVKINAFKPETTSVQNIFGVVGGVKIRVIDTPGLKSSVMEQGFNSKVLAKVKKLVKKYPPDVVLYVDRLDSQTRYLNDVAMLRTITTSLGSSVWQRTILTLTHAGSAPPDGAMGTPLSYDTYVSRATQLIQKSVVAAVDDFRLMNLISGMPLSLVENHPACRKNLKGEKVLPNGETWRSQVLLQCYSRKVLSEANSTLKPRNSFGQRKLFGFLRPPPLAHFVLSLLQSRAHPELSINQGGIPDSELDHFSDANQEEEDEYDQLPPFRPLKKSEFAKLNKDQRKAYFDEYDYRVKLLQKKQWREQCKLLVELKKQGKNYREMPEMFDSENEPSSTTPETLPDSALPPLFDSDNPTYRYRSLRDPNPLFVFKSFPQTRWDHDCGYYGVFIEHDSIIAGRLPAEFQVQLNKDKDVFKFFVDAAVSAKHGESNSSLVGFEVRPVDEQHAYIIRGESKFKLSNKNKTTGGLSVTVLGEIMAPGLKVEHQINLGKRLVVSGKTGTVRHQKNAAYAANLEVRLRGADYPVDPSEHLFALNLLKYGEMAVEANIRPQFQIGRSSKMSLNVGLSTQSKGQIILTTSSSNPVVTLLGTLVSIMVASYYNSKAWRRGCSQ